FSSRRRHTRFSRDWSSDVCSSDLIAPGGAGTGGDLGYLLGNFQAHRVAFVDLRADAQLDTHILTLDGIEGLTGVLHRTADNEGRSEERRVGKECRATWGQEQ